MVSLMLFYGYSVGLTYKLPFIWCVISKTLHQPVTSGSMWMGVWAGALAPALGGQGAPAQARISPPHGGSLPKETGLYQLMLSS